MSDEERKPLLDEIRRNDPSAWPKVRRGIEQAIRDVAERGYCTSLGDWVPEIHSLGVPLDVNSPYGILSALIGGLASTALLRITFDADGNADEAERWNMEARIRDVAVAPDGSVWVIEDDNPGRLRRLTPNATAN